MQVPKLIINCLLMLSVIFSEIVVANPERTFVLASQNAHPVVASPVEENKEMKKKYKPMDRTQGNKNIVRSPNNEKKKGNTESSGIFINNY